MMNKYITTYGGNGYFNLANLAVNANTVFKGKFMPMVAPNDFIFGNFDSPYLALFHPDSNNTWPGNTFRWYINGSEGVAFTASTLGDILGTEFDFEMSSGSITINGQTTTARTFSYRTYSNFGIGYAFSPQFDDAQPIRWGSFQVYDGQTLVYDLVPAYNNGQYCFKNNVDGTFIYAVGNVDGEVSSINVTPSKSSLAYIGETISISVDCENAWTISQVDNWLILLSTGDTGSTTITATAPSYSGVTDRTDTLTFTDSVSGDEAVLSIKQKKYSTGQPVYLGANEVTEIYLGATAITEAYLGDVQVYSSGPFMGLKVSPKTISFSQATLSANLKVKSSEPWTATTPAWITASTLTGNSGEIIISLSATAQTAATAGTIDIITANYSATTNVSYALSMWEFIDSANYDRTKPITKVRFYMGRVPVGTPSLGATESCFTEIPNINTDGLNIFEIDQATNGWPRYHKFNMVYGGGRYTNDFNHTNTTEYQITTTLPVTPSGAYELTYEHPVYWGGVQNNDTTPIYLNGNLVEVYVDYDAI